MKMLLKTAMVTAVSLVVAGVPLLSAKEILPGVTPSENRIQIRTDGLACYFCAYGLERFFKKTKRIAAFDMNMKEGLVEVTPIQGEPLVGAKDLNRYVYDAGFTPRWIKVEFIGQFVNNHNGLSFRVAETGELLPVSSNEVTGRLPYTVFGHIVRIKAVATEYEDAPYLLELEDYSIVEEE